MPKFGFLIVLLTITSIGSVYAQESAVPDSTVCPISEGDAFSRVLIPNETKARLATPSSNFEVDYVNFPNQAKVAFETAVQIWESILISKMPIKIQASWAEINSTTLAYTSATRIFRNFDRAPYSDVWYVVPLAEAISGKDFNPGEYDIKITLNSSVAWSFASNGSIFSGSYDLVTVALHEIAHGLGFISSMKLINNDEQGQWGQNGYPYIYDLFIENQYSAKLTDKSFVTNPSPALKNQLVSNDLQFQVSNSKYANNLPKLHVPNTFRQGESISHLDEYAYPQSSINSLMTPNIRSAEAIHNPGEIAVSILNQLGWPVFNLASFTVLGTEPEPQVLLYPNPTKDKIKVFIPNESRDEQTSIELVNSSGQSVLKLYKDTVLNSNFELSLNPFPSGLYTLAIHSKAGHFTKRVLKN